MRFLYYLFRLLDRFSSSAKIIFLVAFFLLDPLGLVSASDNASKSFINRIQSIFYSSAAQKEVTVVLLDDEYLKATQSYWPLPYNQQAKIFKRILHYQPNALFIDLLYSHDRSTTKDSVQRIVNIFERYEKRNNTPIYLAKVENEHNQRPKAFEQYSRWASVSWQGFEKNYPFVVDGTDTAAAVLYKVYCQATEKCIFDSRFFQSPLVLQWGLKLSEIQNSLTINTHCEIKGSNASLLVKLSLSDIFWRLKSKFRQVCPYTTTVMASSLLANDKEAKELFEHVFRNKIVLLGAKIEGARDLISSPIHGQVAGVYLHAMALDNLITYGQRYTREPPLFFATSISWLEIMEITFVMFIMYFRWMIERGNKESFIGCGQGNKVTNSQNTSVASATYAHRALNMVLITLLVVTLIILFFTNYETINFIGLFLVAASFLPSNKLRGISNLLKRQIQRITNNKKINEEKT
ncbi:CHASE2 domain-containing protein [Cognaticolwellia mytili]|uniref:CHASE2 domain-containing protein n=1 Tax=Cognaticolwellia mytili TaxID=1888913 RepID=UPI0013020A31|nr:CHASE2 domain-containing protein [Cognaticolwellia mytili]